MKQIQDGAKLIFRFDLGGWDLRRLSLLTLHGHPIQSGLQNRKATCLIGNTLI